MTRSLDVPCPGLRRPRALGVWGEVDRAVEIGGVNGPAGWRDDQDEVGGGSPRSVRDLQPSLSSDLTKTTGMAHFVHRLDEVGAEDADSAR